MTSARAFAFAILLSLPGCALRPMYAGGASGPVATSLGQVAVAPIPGRGGWLVRNALVDRLGGEHRSSTHRLEVELDDDISSFGIRGDRSVTRERRTLRARYRLVEVATGQVVLDATAGSDAGIDVVSSPYATVAAEQTALERLATMIADQMVGRLALYATNRPIAR
ncbi:MAG: LPS assembly lipoprotein LptE [Sphingomonas bacterium]|nr:LPS assembly lipoprotein LptE [Sphingomonas bacterium]